MDLGIIFNVNEEWSLRKHPPCRFSFKIGGSSANESLEGSWMSLRLWRRGGRGHPEAEAATHSPNPHSGRKVLECIFSPEICMCDHRGKRSVLEQLMGSCGVCAELLKQENQHL